MGTSWNFGTENYVGRLDIAQNLCDFCQFFLYDFWCAKSPNTRFFIIRKIFIRKWVSHASQASPALHAWFGIFITTDFSWSSLKVTKMSKF